MLDLLAVILAAAVPQTANTPETLPAAQPTAPMQLPVQTLPRANSLQQAFDAASADASAGKCAEAVAAFEALERNPKVKPGSLSAAAMSVRKGQCLVRLGRYAEGEMAIAAGLPALEKAGGNFDADVAEGQIALGDAAMSPMGLYRCELGLS